MSPTLAAAIAAAEDLAWRPIANQVGVAYHERLEVAQRMRDLIT